MTVSVGNATVTEGNTGHDDRERAGDAVARVDLDGHGRRDDGRRHGARPAATSSSKTATLTFSPGVTTVNFAVAIVGDTVKESTETFTVVLSSPTGGATIATGTGTVTIVDNDGAMLAAEAAPAGSAVAPLTADALAPVVAQAEACGAPRCRAQTSAASRSRSATSRPPARLDGRHGDHDRRDAAGLGLVGDGSRVAAGHMDLLTVVLHELGRVLGFTTDDADRFPVMTAELAPGEQLLLATSTTGTASTSDSSASTTGTTVTTTAGTGTAGTGTSGTTTTGTTGSSAATTDLATSEATTTGTTGTSAGTGTPTVVGGPPTTLTLTSTVAGSPVEIGNTVVNNTNVLAITVDGQTTYRTVDSVTSLSVKADALIVDVNQGSIAAPITYDGPSLAIVNSPVASDWTINGDGTGTVTGGGISSISFKNTTSISAGGPSDTLHGPSSDSNWTIDGNGAGSVAGTETGTETPTTFTGFENLTGAPDNKDAFVLEPSGALAGVADGGKAATTAWSSTASGPRSSRTPPTRTPGR